MRASLVAMCLAATLAPAGALAQVGKPTTMIIGFGPGGGYDLWGHTVARHIGKHLPGAPTVVTQNMPGAGSYVAASHIANVAPKDGTVMGIIARDAVLGPLVQSEGARFDPLRMTWLGTPTVETNICIANANAKVKTFDDLLKTELVVGDTGPGTGTRSYPLALNALLGTKFKLVSGFPASSDVFLAMERGEVDGICESLDSVIGKRPDWISSGKVNVLFQGGAEPNPELKDTPFILKKISDDEQRQEIKFLYAGQGIGRPFVAPGGMAQDKVAQVQAAFSETMQDADFVADAKKQGLSLAPLNGFALSIYVASIYATPKRIIEKVGKYIQ